MWRTNGMVPSAKFPFLNIIGSHHPTTSMGVCYQKHLLTDQTLHPHTFFVEVLDKICRTCYHTDPRFGTKPYYGVHASTPPQVHIHQNHRDYPLEIHNWWMWRTNGMVPSAKFPFLHLIGPHTLPITIMGVCLWNTPLQGQNSAIFWKWMHLWTDKTLPFWRINTPKMTKLRHFWKWIHL